MEKNLVSKCDHRQEMEIDRAFILKTFTFQMLFLKISAKFKYLIN